MTSAWDALNLARHIDGYWSTPPEVEFRQAVLDDLRTRLVPGQILDVGCGSGRIYGALRDAGLLSEHSYRGGDTSQEMLAIAQETYPYEYFETLDIFDLQAKAENVICIQVLQHVENWQAALAQLLRASNKLLYVVTWFGDGDKHFDVTTGFWNNWLDFEEFKVMCAKHGSVERIPLSGTVSAVAVLK